MAGEHLEPRDYPSTEVSGINTAKLLRLAFSRLAQAPREAVSLIVDGGPENNNRTVEATLKP